MGTAFPYLAHILLLPVVQVNKRFNAVATPLLVRDWHLRPADESGAKFVLHLLKHPQLRSRVKSLTIDERGFRKRIPIQYATDYRWPQSLCSTAELEQLATSAEETCPMLACWVDEHEEASWSGQVRQRRPNAIAALALAWATGLQELDLMVDDWTVSGGPGSWICRLVQMAVGVLPPLGVEGRDLPLPDVSTKLRCVSLSKRMYTPCLLQWPRYECPRLYPRGPRSIADIYRLPRCTCSILSSLEATGFQGPQAQDR